MNPVNHTGPAAFTLFVAAVFQLLPVPGDWLLWKPNFLLLTVIAWILLEPNQFGLVFAAIAGLLADVLFRNLFGQYMLVFALCGYVLYLFSRRVTHFSILHQALLVMVMVIFVEFIQSIFLTVRNIPVNWKHLPAMALVSGLIWPLVFISIDKLHRSQLQHH